MSLGFFEKRGRGRPSNARKVKGGGHKECKKAMQPPRRVGKRGFLLGRNMWGGDGVRAGARGGFFRDKEK